MLFCTCPPVSTEMKDLPGTPNNSNHYPKHKMVISYKVFCPWRWDWEPKSKVSLCHTQPKLLSHQWPYFLIHERPDIFFVSLWLSYLIVGCYCRNSGHWNIPIAPENHVVNCNYFTMQLRLLRWNEYISILEPQFDFMTFSVHTHAIFAMWLMVVAWWN